MMVRLLSLLLATSALSLSLAAASDVHVHVRVHHHHHHQQHTTVEAHGTPLKPARKLFHVTGAKAAFDQMLTPSMQKELQLDVWRVARVGASNSDTLMADISATDEAMATLQANMKRSSGKTPIHSKHLGVENHFKLYIKQASELTDDERIAQDRKQVAACLKATKGYETKLPTADRYVKSPYFNCFRPYDQIGAFFDSLTELNPNFVTKIYNVSTTYEDRSIHAYKLSTTNVDRRLAEQNPKKAVYTQALMHAREWQAGASTHYTFASLLDDLRAGDAETLKLFDDIDWYFVPLVNIDGYKYSWDVDRYWRVNRHAANGYDGVDLNRNYPPEEFFDLDKTDVSEETNPGDAPLSEPETRGLNAFMMNLPELLGVVDVHAFGGMVLRPFSDVQGEPEEPYGSRMKQLGGNVRDAMSPLKDGFQYVSQPAGALYPAYGCVDDAVYRMTNYTVPALTIEVEGDDFIAPQSTIRDVGKDVNNGLRRFVVEAHKYHAFIEELAATK